MIKLYNKYPASPNQHSSLLHMQASGFHSWLHIRIRVEAFKNLDINLYPILTHLGWEPSISIFIKHPQVFPICNKVWGLLAYPKAKM